MIITNPENSSLSIYEQSKEDKDGNITIEYVRKITIPDLANQIKLEKLHHVVATGAMELLILFDESDMCVCDLRN